MRGLAVCTGFAVSYQHESLWKKCWNGLREVRRFRGEDIEMDTRALKDLAGIGPAMLKDFEQLGIASVEQLAAADPDGLYERLCVLTGARQDPCVLDTFRCAAAQARDPELPVEQRNWWWWSKVRKEARG